jgi:phenylalanyl-tRNA synthetase alpha chain
MTGGVELTNPERRMLRAMLAASGDVHSLEQIMNACDWNDQAVAVGAGQGLSDKGLVEIQESVRRVIHPGQEGHNAIANGLLETRLWSWISSQDDPSMVKLQAKFERHEAGPGVGLLKKLGVQLESGTFVCEDSSSLKSELQARNMFLASLPADEEDLSERLLSHFKGRKELIEVVEHRTRTWKLTDTGKAMSNDGLEERKQVSEITPELLQSGQWKDAEFRSFDVTLESATPRTGRSHPMQELIERIRRIFLEMGFSELVDDYVQTAGWNMDALFIPQDHPAREMQDTFYLTNPEHIKIEENYLKDWTSIHEHGGETGSTGWGGSYSTEESQKGLLRTHTTVNTIRYLAETPDVPCRVFGIGRVFRKETIDRTHLPEFHQIEGIIMEPGASLPMLVTTLKTFYEKMGYPEVRVRPAYFPYTEPSLEVEVKWRGQWLELGGAGIFRPEVTEPLGCQWPVCAWGMGLERLAMLVLGLDDIRQLYISDLEWLRNQPLL